MRQRKAKKLPERILELAGGEWLTPEEQKGKWQELFKNKQPLFLELGCGKGQFIIEMAKRHPDRNYIAVEGQCTVILRALEKARGIEPKSAESWKEPDFPEVENQEIEDAVYAAGDNLVFVNAFMRGVDKYFEEEELDGIFLNFSDPWPKIRHAKRRLTHTLFLDSYKRVLKKWSAIEFKSDNDPLFEFSVNEFEKNGLLLLEISRDLHNDPADHEASHVCTEYEDKFAAKGKNINYCKAIVL